MNTRPHPSQFATPKVRVVIDTAFAADALAMGLECRTEFDEAEGLRITRTLHPQVGPMLTFAGPDGSVEIVGAQAMRTLIAEAQDALRLAVAS